MIEFVPRALTIAGSDSGGGAGIQADLKTFTALGVYGASVITSVTAQNTEAFLGAHDLPSKFVELQIDAVINDIGIQAVKTGMLSSRAIVLSIVKKIKEHGISKLVVDPVMKSKSGDILLEEEATKVLIDELLELTYLLTPNVPEAEIISGVKIKSIDDMKKAAVKIKSLGPDFVLVKGGHVKSVDDATDLLYDGGDFHELKASRIDTNNTHGTGCTYSAAICAYLAKGLEPIEAVRKAKSYLTSAIKSSFNLGRGQGPLNHYWKLN